MTERPILFSGEMVKAILEGRKTQTRRIIKPQPIYIPFPNPSEEANGLWTTEVITREGKIIPSLRRGTFTWDDDCTPHENLLFKCPYGQPGDRLWVRESGVLCQPYAPDHKGPWWTFKDGSQNYSWDSKCYVPKNPAKDGWWKEQKTKLKPSIHMPRWASRITLEIVNVKVERLNDISAEDCKAEGTEAPVMSGCHGKPTQEDLQKLAAIGWRWSYRLLWESLNGPDSWEKNPWVWCIEFRRIKP